MDKIEYFWIRSRLEQEEEPARHDAGRTLCPARRLQFSALKKRATVWLRHCLDPSASALLRSGWFLPEIEDEVRYVVFWPGKRDSCSWKHIIEMARRIENGGANSIEATAAEPQARIDLSRRVHGLAAWFLRRYDMDAAFLWIVAQASIQPGRVAGVIRWVTKLPSLLPIALAAAPLVAILYAAFWGVRWKDLPAADMVTPLVVGSIALAGVCWAALRRRNRPAFGLKAPLPSYPASWSIGLVMVALAAVYILADLGAFNTPGGWQARREAFGVLLCLPFIPVAILLVVSLYRAGAILALGVLRLAVPRMFFAVAAAWTLMITTEEVVKANVLVDWTRIVLVAVPLVTLSLIFTTVEVNSQISAPGRALERAVRLVAVSFLISFGVGFFATNFIMPRYLEYSGVLTSREFEAHAVRYGGLPPLENETQETPWVRASAESARHTVLDQTRARFLALEQLQWGLPGSFLTSGTEPGIRVMYAVEPPFPAVSVIPKALQFEWYFFPGVQLYTACFAMFAGLFFNLVFQGRLLTDPL